MWECVSVGEEEEKDRDGAVSLSCRSCPVAPL